MQPFSVSAVSALCHRVMGRSLRGATAGDRLMFDSFQGRFRGPRQHTSIRMKSRTVARTIPRPFGVVPVDDATQVRANGRHPVQFSLGIARAGHALSRTLQEIGRSQARDSAPDDNRVIMAALRDPGKSRDPRFLPNAVGVVCHCCLTLGERCANAQPAPPLLRFADERGRI
jgi:acyl transferase domain-containing protein